MYFVKLNQPNVVTRIQKMGLLKIKTIQQRLYSSEVQDHKFKNLIFEILWSKTGLDYQAFLVIINTISLATLYGHQQTFWRKVARYYNHICCPRWAERKGRAADWYISYSSIRHSIAVFNTHNRSQQNFPKTMKHRYFLKVNLF